MKKLFNFSWLTARFFKPRRRTIRPVFGRLESLQLRTVPAAIAAMPVDDATEVVDQSEDSGENGETPELVVCYTGMEGWDQVAAEDCVVTEEGTDGEVVEGEDPVPMMFMAFSGVPVDGEENIEAFEATDGEVVDGEVVTFEEGSDEFDGEVPVKWMYFSAPMSDATGEEGEAVEITTFEESGEVFEKDASNSEESEVTDEVVVEDGDKVDEGEVVDRSSNDGEIKPYYRTLSVTPTSEEAGEEEVVTDDSTGEEVLYKGELVDGETANDGEGIDNPEILYTLGGPLVGDTGGEEEVVEDGEVTDKSGEVEEEFNPEVIYYSNIGGGGDGGAEGGNEEEVLVTPTSENTEDNPEIRTLGGVGEVTTFDGVVELCVAEYSAAGDSFAADLQGHVANFVQLVGLINEGIAQNARDIAAAAAAGDTAAIEAELAQNQALLGQLTQLVTSYVNGIGEIQQNYISRISAASNALNQAAANPNEISTAAASFSSSRLAIRPAYSNDLSSFETELQTLIAEQNGDDSGNEGFAPGEPNPTGDMARIRMGNAQASATITEINQSVTLTGDIESVAQPGVDETVTVNVNLWSYDDTLGDEPLYVSGVTGNVVLTGTDDGADITGGKLTIDGFNGDNPFSVTIDVPAETADSATFDDNGNLSGLSGQYAIPATEGLLPNGGTLVVTVSLSQVAE